MRKHQERGKLFEELACSAFCENSGVTDWEETNSQDAQLNRMYIQYVVINYSRERISGSSLLGMPKDAKQRNYTYSIYGVEKILYMMQETWKHCGSYMYMVQQQFSYAIKACDEDIEGKWGKNTENIYVNVQ